MTVPYLFIVNPVSNRGKSARFLPRIERYLATRGIVHDYATTTGPGHAVTIAREKAFDYDVLVAVGGDGTVHEVANGLMQARLSNHEVKTPAGLGIVPIGSGNDFVKMIGRYRDVDDAIACLETHRLMPLDIGELTVDGQVPIFFTNNVGIGFDAFVNAESLKIKVVKGVLMYLAAALKSIFQYDHPIVEWEADGARQSDKVLLINAGNGRCSGGGFYLTPDAEINDGRLDVCVIRSLTKRGILMKLPKTFSGAHRDLEDVRLFRTTDLQIRSSNDLPIHADGEVISLKAHEVRIRILPSALRVLAPAATGVSS